MKKVLILWCLIAELFIVGRVCGQPRSGSIIWKYDLGGIVTCPTLAPDGTVYVASGSLLYAVTNAGPVASNRWSVAVQISGSPAVGPDGTIYFLTLPGPLTALAPDGTRKWTFPVAIAGGGSPAIAADGTVYFFSGGRLYAVSASGTEKWDQLIRNGGFGATPYAPVIGSDGTIYMVDGAVSKICAFSPDGTNKWSVALPSGLAAEAPGIASDGSIYYADGVLYALSPMGTISWSSDYNSNRWFAGVPVVGARGSIYVATTLPTPLWAVAPGGQADWSALGSLNPDINTPAVDAGGMIYYCVSNSIWSLNPQGQVQWAITAPPSQQGDTAITSPIIGADGTLYATLGNTLYAVSTGTNGPANSPWPMYQQNAQHTGRVQKPVLNRPQKRADANFEFELYPQQLGLTYTIQSSTNFNDWTTLTSVVATTLPMDVVDLSASNFPSRFYRASSPQ